MRSPEVKNFLIFSPTRTKNFDFARNVRTNSAEKQFDKDAESKIGNLCATKNQSKNVVINIWDGLLLTKLVLLKILELIYKYSKPQVQFMFYEKAQTV